VTLRSQNIRQNLTAMGVEPTLGLQWAFGGKFSVGLTVRQGFIVSQGCDQNVERRDVIVPKAVADSVDVNQGRNVDATSAYTINEVIQNKKLEKPLGGWPMQSRLGFAWFASTRLLWTADVTYHGAAKTSDSDLFVKEAIMNYATGAEYYVTPSIPLRFGFFTNNDNRPEVKSGGHGQADHIDYYGGSIFAGWTQPNSQLAVGGTVQQGKGKAQKTGDYNTQDVEAFAYTLGFTVAHLL